VRCNGYQQNYDSTMVSDQWKSHSKADIHSSAFWKTERRPRMTVVGRTRSEYVRPRVGGPIPVRSQRAYARGGQGIALRGYDAAGVRPNAAGCVQGRLLQAEVIRATGAHGAKSQSHYNRGGSYRRPSENYPQRDFKN
jgi:hypothetical protein